MNHDNYNKTKNKFLDYRFKQSNFIYLRNFFSFLLVEVLIVISWGHMVPINKSHAACREEDADLVLRFMASNGLVANPSKNKCQK